MYFEDKFTFIQELSRMTVGGKDIRTFEFVLADVDHGGWVHGCREEVVHHFGFNFRQRKGIGGGMERDAGMEKVFKKSRKNETFQER